jgi:hypothetical protein
MPTGKKGKLKMANDTEQWSRPDFCNRDPCWKRKNSGNRRIEATEFGLAGLSFRRNVSRIWKWIWRVSAQLNMVSSKWTGKNSVHLVG